MTERFGSLNNNYDKIREILGEDYLEKSLNDTLTREEFIEANYKIGSFVMEKK